MKRQYSTPDGIQLASHDHRPAGPPRSVVLLVHGYAEHSGRYTHVIDHFVAHGHAVVAYDLRGHGRSEGPRAFVASFDDHLDDLSLMLAHARQAYPDTPFILFGHSMGGAIVALCCMERHPDVTGLMLSSPAIQLPDIAPLLQKFSGLVARLFPRLPTIRLSPAHLSRTPEVVDRVLSDPLFYRGRMPASTGAALVEATHRIQTHMEDLTLPFLVLHGTADQITKPEGSEALYQHAGSTDKTLALYPHLYHETFNEPEKAQVLEDMTTWLDQHTPALS